MFHRAAGVGRTSRSATLDEVVNDLPMLSFSPTFRRNITRSSAWQAHNATPHCIYEDAGDVDGGDDLDDDHDGDDDGDVEDDDDDGDNDEGDDDEEDDDDDEDD